MSANATYVMVSEGGKDFIIFLGNGTLVQARGFILEANEKTNAILEYKNGEYYFTCDKPVTITNARGKEKVMEKNCLSKDYFMKGIILTISLFTCIIANSQTYKSQVWISDQGNGVYKNPVLYADYSDPDVIRTGDDFYMTASSFNCVPGLPVLHSKDLVNWKIINYALSDLYMEGVEPAGFFDKVQHGKGVWAPCIRYHKGEYMVYWGDPDFGIYVVKTKDILGRWDKSVLVLPGKGRIDPSPLFDDDGKVYLTHAWAGSRAGFNSVMTVCEMNEDGTKVIGEESLIFDGNDGVNHTVEGGKFYKKDGYYYLLAPTGGVAMGWQIALRSKNIYGPYEVKRVLDRGNTSINGPHQGGLVETQTGESWFIHFQDKGPYGRIIHLQPVTWKDG